jgi:signal transduction histidine kinase/ligand-binding sensor domain-containing protein
MPGWFFGFVLAWGTAAWALEPSTPLASYGRQTWVMENGLPQNTVQALAQSSDGFIWLGTEVGLVRFDGNNFVVLDRNSKPALPGGDVTCLLAAKDGSLWIGTTDGLARLLDGVVTTFTTGNGLPGNSIRSLREGGQGGVIVSTDGGEISIEGERVGPVQSGTLQGAALLQDVELAGGIRAVVNKTTVELEQSGRVVQHWTVGKELPGTRIQTAYADRDGELWIGTNGGLVRETAGKLERFPVTDALATASILSILEDREGNLWVGTETGGLHILRDERFRTLGARDGLSADATTTVVEDSTGTLWVGTSGYGLNAVTRSGPNFSRTKNYTARDGLTSDIILSLAAAPDGEIWVGTPDGLNRIRHGAITAITTADGLPDDFIRSLLVDADGSVWMGTRRGLAHLIAKGTNLHIDTFTQSTGLGSDLVGAMARGSNGNLWVATLAGLSRLSGGARPAITNYTAANGLSSNVITALLPRNNGTLLVGTQDHGWNRWDGKRFSAVSESGLSHKTIHAILDDEEGHLWFATGDGIARCDCDMDGGCSHWMEFGPADGLRTREMAANSHPSAWRSHDGLLWFATPKGLVEADPAHFPVNRVPPPVALVRFAVDDVEQPLLGSDKIPAGHNHFQFDYAGLSFTAPQKVRYRYMLEGFDHQWTDAGARRSAYYTNIPPGHYTFRVQAANNDGVWNMEGTSLSFQLRPHFYQTIWFYLLLVAFAAGLVLLALRLRLLRAEREFRAVLAERNRIAREVHDTLAQGYVGVSVQLEVLSELLRNNKNDAAIRHLDTTRQHVREGLAEARQSIWALRSQDGDEHTLPVKLRRATEHANGHGVEATFGLYGAYRPVPPGMEREILRVGQEAIHNVKKHAVAKHLSVQLEYGPAEIALVVSDDGRGFAMNGAGPGPGHYGLTGMRERAEIIGGTLEVTSEVGAGTTVRLHVTTPREASQGTGEDRGENGRA